MLDHLWKVKMAIEGQAKPGEQSRTQERNMYNLRVLHLERVKLLNRGTRLKLDHLHMFDSWKPYGKDWSSVAILEH